MRSRVPHAKRYPAPTGEQIAVYNGNLEMRFLVVMQPVGMWTESGPALAFTPDTVQYRTGPRHGQQLADARARAAGRLTSAQQPRRW
jgi:hypothetical protein